MFQVFETMRRELIELTQALIRIPSYTGEEKPLADFILSKLQEYNTDDAFIDGNKRVALACAILFFKINNVPYSITEEEAVELTQAAANGQMDKGAVTEFFRRHLKIPQDP